MPIRVGDMCRPEAPEATGTTLTNNTYAVSAGVVTLIQQVLIADAGPHADSEIRTITNLLKLDELNKEDRYVALIVWRGNTQSDELVVSSLGPHSAASTAALLSQRRPNEPDEPGLHQIKRAWLPGPRRAA